MLKKCPTSYITYLLRISKFKYQPFRKTNNVYSVHHTIFGARVYNKNKMIVKWKCNTTAIQLISIFILCFHKKLTQIKKTFSFVNMKSGTLNLVVNKLHANTVTITIEKT